MRGSCLANKTEPSWDYGRGCLADGGCESDWRLLRRGCASQGNVFCFLFLFPYRFFYFIRSILVKIGEGVSVFVVAFIYFFLGGEGGACARAVVAFVDILRSCFIIVKVWALTVARYDKAGVHIGGTWGTCARENIGH